MLDAEGRPSAGFRLEEADGLRGNGLDKLVTWKGSPHIGALAGQPVRLRFVMRGMKLYAFEFGLGK